ncbi:prephenate/arogenate dehydrogenase [Limnoraphis robusta]|uniref:Prephenate/arogenate dehydrogenase n=1 Tax=Limnoraphis robusta CCNP1315 TaxID=3110306 RepID=A0ABU5U335_9CYAN|nr:prephenate/arogenate dehydrogenase [Limnoraphis robusta]MEA5521316.1 prephenate/arogenate dehydrogenase [Limnoraphis robusta CCNP1315]MEA5548929.1 prephenate/arogenate dehydrogenase [Limnoraphis robusta CCNP1324]
MNIGIVGLGLIGGSMGLDLCSIQPKLIQLQADNYPSNGQAYRVLGVSRHSSTCEKAIAMGVVDEASVDLSLMARADVVFICTPIAAIASTLEQLIPYLKPTTIVTDVGSVKQPIVETLSKLWPHFVGGHPMAGTAESGIEAAQKNLFLGNPYVITPTETTSNYDLEIVTQIAHLLQAKVYQCSPQDHDKTVAWISHLPVTVSASLIAALTAEEDVNVQQLAQQLASSGFRDTSRVGGGNPELGVMMARYNRTALLRSLQAYRSSLDGLIHLIEQEDWDSLEQQLIQTQQDRRKFNF